MFVGVNQIHAPHSANIRKAGHITEYALLAVLLLVVDAALGADARKLVMAPALPVQAGVGRAAEAEFTLAFAGGLPPGAELELETNSRLSVADSDPRT